MKPDTAERLSSPEVRRLMKIVTRYHRDGRLTVRSCAEAMGVSVATAHVHLQNLREKGWVTWEEGTHATIRPTVTWLYAKEHPWTPGN